MFRFYLFFLFCFWVMKIFGVLVFTKIFWIVLARWIEMWIWEGNISKIFFWTLTLSILVWGEWIFNCFLVEVFALSCFISTQTFLTFLMGKNSYGRSYWVKIQTKKFRLVLVDWRSIWTILKFHKYFFDRSP